MTRQEKTLQEIRVKLFTIRGHLEDINNEIHDAENPISAEIRKEIDNLIQTRIDATTLVRVAQKDFPAID